MAGGRRGSQRFKPREVKCSIAKSMVKGPNASNNIGGIQGLSVTPSWQPARKEGHLPTIEKKTNL